MSKSLSLINQRFNKLLVIDRAENSKNGKTRWICKCDCGNQTIVYRDNLVRGKTKSCGCARYESHNQKHGFTKTDIHNKWLSMRQRCNDKNHKSYLTYGAKGITVCDEWNKSFESFANWSFNNGYKEGLSLDRIDNSKGYCPSNCRWIDWKKQCNNRKSNIVIDYKGESKTLKQWQEELGFDYRFVNQRIYKYGYSFEDAISIPKYAKRKLTSNTIK